MTERERFEAKFPMPAGVQWNGSKYLVQDGWENSYRCDRFVAQWAAWQAARATPAAHSISLTDKQLMILNNSSFRLYAKGEKRASLKLDAVIAELSIPENLTQKLSHIDKQGYAHMKVSDDTKGPRGVDDAAGRDRSVPRTGDQNDPELSPGQCAIEEAIGKLHTAKSPLADKENVAALILEAIDKLNWISANPESFSATPAAHSVPVAWMYEFNGTRVFHHARLDHLEWDSAKQDYAKGVPVFTTAPQPPQSAADHIDAHSVTQLVTALAECRDALPIPEEASSLESDWASAVGDPLSVPHYIRAYVAAQSDAQSVRDAAIEECAMVCEHIANVQRVHHVVASVAEGCAMDIRRLKNEKV